MASLIVSGTPAATVVEDPKLDRMSARTTPLWARMSGPFEPSPGNGPAVSSGITAHEAALIGLALPAAVAPLAAAALDPAGAQPTRAMRPAPSDP